MDRTQVVTSISTELYATEQSVDAAIAHAAAMVQAMISGRAALSVSPVAASASQTKALATLAALSTAREAIVECHAEMQKDHRRMGWGVYAAGPADKPLEWDDTPMSPKKSAHLRAV
ncbi:hypothetical protein GCM10009093_18990 [Brevundimonas terrae]|uniref:Uncharacterized protein n=1 Tax=Brevundimonas terrae TaxID=363631 RepID=A0ABN0YFX0_9CAUL|nr:hypothetical protein [Brevundimonas terrae]NIJ26641.1 hypothetical protein [Brevundimonas terrae]